MNRGRATTGTAYIPQIEPKIFYTSHRRYSRGVNGSVGQAIRAVIDQHQSIERVDGGYHFIV